MSGQFDICVIGAGISGASFAYRCARAGASVVVLEKETQPGGCIKSHRYNDGLIAELGTRTLTNTYKTVIELLEDAGADHLIETLETSKFKLAVGDSHKSILSQLSFMSAALSLPKMFFADKTGKSLKTHYSSVFGEKNYERLFRYAFSAVLSQPADDYPADLLFRKRERDKTRPKQFTLKGGNLALVETLLGQSNIELRMSAQADSITREQGHFSIDASDRGLISAKSIAIAVPSNAAAQLTRHVAPNLSALLSQLKSGPIYTVHVAVKQDRAVPNLTSNLIGVDKPYYSVIHTPGDAKDTYSFHFKGDARPADADLPDILAQALQCDPSEIDIVTTRESVLPHLKADKLDIIKEIERTLDTSDVFLPCNYLQGLSVEDCCLQSKREFERWTEHRLSSVHGTMTGL
ncbi:MAG: FAD-dependent oxidoreductase [Pseudomonadota bacterium]